MSRGPFTIMELQRPTWWQRLTGRPPRENAVAETNNLLARAAGVRSVQPEEIEWICRAHHVALRELSGRTERLYRDYLTHCFADHRLSDEEVADLQHLARILRLEPSSVAAIHENVARQVFCMSVTEVLADGRIDAEERAFLDRLQRELALSDRTARRIEDAKLKGVPR